MSDVDLKLYEAFDCRPSMLGWGGDPQADGKRAKVDRIHRYYLKHKPKVHSVDQMIRVVREEWTAGLGPIASYLMWTAMKWLIKSVVVWLWKYYHSADGLAGNSQN